MTSLTLADVSPMFNNEILAKKAIKNPEVLSVLKGTFGPGRTSYLHTTKLPNGTEVRLKFTNTVKQILNSKGKEVPGKESFLSYFEVIVLPSAGKGFCFTSDVTQVVWAPLKSKAVLKHQEALNSLIQFGESVQIDLSAESSWNTLYSQNY